VRLHKLSLKNCMMTALFDITTFLRNALAEDIGTGDITSAATIPADATATFVMRARQDLIVCGVKFIPELFALISPRVQVEIMLKDGALATKGATIARISGPARALLEGERTALNLVQHLSGIATVTHSYVDAIKGTHARIYDIRKTIPGMRQLQKYAVKCGGGENHRMGLYDAVLIKDNHIAVVGSVKAAIEAARTAAPKGMIVQVECDTLAQVAEAITAKPDIILLDNMDNETLRNAVALIKPHGIQTEASGNVSLETVRAIAETGVDRISIGKLTHSVMAVDIGLDEA